MADLFNFFSLNHFTIDIFHLVVTETKKKKKQLLLYSTFPYPGDDFLIYIQCELDLCNNSQLFYIKILMNATFFQKSVSISATESV